jgi:hypothetical protein
LARKLDSFLRFVDLAAQRIDAGSAFEKRFAIRRHTLLSYLWPTAVTSAVWIGMPAFTDWRNHLAALLAAVVSLLLLLGIAYASRNKGATFDACAQAGFVLMCCAIVAIFGGRTVPDGVGIYLHLLVPVVAVVANSIIVIAFVTPYCFKAYQTDSKYEAYIKETELFQARPDIHSVGIGAIAQAAVLTLMRLVRLLLAPAAAALLVERVYLPWIPPAVLAASFLFLILAGLDERLDYILNQLSSRFVHNGALAVSLVVIALGVARYFDISYVSTIFDTAAGVEIGLYLFFAYAITWWHDYWLERLAGQQLLRIANPSARDADIGFPYAITGERLHSVPEDQRIIQLHGIGRFLVLRPDTFVRAKVKGYVPRWVGDRFPAFHTWSYADFFNHLATCAKPLGNAHPSPQKIAQRILQHAAISRVLTAATLAGVFLAIHFYVVQEPAGTAKSSQPTNVHLAELLEKHAVDRPLVLVAASGGGTRAALFTSAVLEGLYHEGVKDDIVLGSGVSGGGASLAYFAANRGNLCEEKNWTQYFDAMRQPFIRDVLDRASEWRIVTEKRTGTLLEESFARRWKLPNGRTRLGEIQDMGLIFNTTLAGHFEDRGKFPGATFAERATKGVALHQSVLAGGRLILTNLAIRDAFAQATMPYEQPELPVIVDDRDLSLVRASALNANFPPVFANAPVDVDEKYRYWVTDGGAADNRGAEMLLYALRKALQDRPALRHRKILVLIVDAGAAPGAFSPGDRGLGSAIGAGSQFAMHLVAELRRGMPDTVTFHYLPMPHLLRASGSFGTHWMLQENIAVKNEDLDLWLHGTDVIEVLRHLYAKRAISPDLEPNAKKTLDWLKEKSTEYTKN